MASTSSGIQTRPHWWETSALTIATLSPSGVSFVFPVGWGIGREEIKMKRAGAGEKGNEIARPLRAPDFSISPFSLSFPVFSPFLH